jgi:NAD(P)H-dependent flavin oxidoreductase YrpB (nitropropane dioxygenase family)
MKLHTPLCDILGIEHPIIQAGMGWDKHGSTTPPALVAAVSNAGGLGMIGGSPMQPDLIRERIRAIKALTDRPFGVDITWPRLSEAPSADPRQARDVIEREHPGHLTFVQNLLGELALEPQEPDKASWVKTLDGVRRQLAVILEEQVPILAIGLGDTAEVVPQAHAVGTKVMALCGTARQALSHARNGVDVIIAQGYEAGGHTGRIANFPLIPQVVDAVRPIPVVVAGGIADGRGLAAALSLGAVGVWCGTVFLISQESAIHPDYREQLVVGRSEDFVLDRYPSGKTSRHYRSEVIRAWEKSGLAPLEMPFQGVLNDELRVAAEAADRVSVMSVPGGQIAGLLGPAAVRPAADVLRDMSAQAARILQEMATGYLVPDGAPVG